MSISCVAGRAVIRIGSSGPELASVPPDVDVVAVVAETGFGKHGVESAVTTPLLTIDQGARLVDTVPEGIRWREIT